MNLSAMCDVWDFLLVGKTEEHLNTLLQEHQRYLCKMGKIEENKMAQECNDAGRNEQAVLDPLPGKRFLNLRAQLLRNLHKSDSQPSNPALAQAYSSSNDKTGLCAKGAKLLRAYREQPPVIEEELRKRGDDQLGDRRCLRFFT